MRREEEGREEATATVESREATLGAGLKALAKAAACGANCCQTIGRRFHLRCKQRAVAC